jgi:hypothetical protein
VLFVIFFVLSNEENNFGDYNFKMLTWEIFDRAENILGIILVVSCCLLLTIIFEEYLYPILDPTLYQKFRAKNLGKNKNHIFFILFFYKRKLITILEGQEFTNRDIRMSCSVDM